MASSRKSRLRITKVRRWFCFLSAGLRFRLPDGNPGVFGPSRRVQRARYRSDRRLRRSKFTHKAWANTERSDGGIKGVNYPLVSDLNKEIARNYGVLLEDAGIALRGLFMINKDGILKQATINHPRPGKKYDEVLRLLDAIDHTEKHGEVCPANWKSGDKAMKPTRRPARIRSQVVVNLGNEYNGK